MTGALTYSQKGQTNGEYVYNVPGLFEEVPDSHLFEDAQTVDDVVQGGEDEEDLASEGDVSSQIPLSGETENVDPVVRQDSSSNKLGHNLDDTEEVDLSVVERELGDEGPGPVVYPVLLLEGLKPLLQFVNVTSQSKLVATPAVVTEVRVDVAGLPLLLGHELELSHPSAVLVKQRLPALTVSLGVLVEDGDPQLASAAVHEVPHDLVGVAGPGLLSHLSHHGVPNDPVDSVIQVTSEAVGRGSVVPVLHSDIRYESVVHPHPPLVDLSHFLEINVRVGLHFPRLVRSLY